MKGFTLIEFIITLAIIVVMATVSLVGLSSYRGRQNLSLSVDEVVAVVRDTQNRSITQQDGQQWGIRFNNSTEDQYTVFKGVSYASGTVDRVYSFRRGVSFSEPPANFLIDIIFSPLTGKPTFTKIISLIGSAGQQLVGDIILNASGLVTSRVESGLVGYWHLDEATSTSAYDASGNGNTGTLTNGPTWQSAANCKVGACLSFDGIDDYVQMTMDVPEYNFTMEAWVKTTDVNGGVMNVIDGVIPCSNGCDRDIGIQNGMAYARVWQGAGWSTGKVVNDGVWHHWALTVQTGVGQKFYVDGVQVGTFSYDHSDFNWQTKFVVGESADLGFLNGLIDDIRIYNRALTADEISATYNATK